MGEPVFFLQIADRDGRVIHIPAGGALELDLVKTLVSHAVEDFLGRPALRHQFLKAIKTRISEKSIGVFRTKAQVLRAVEEGLAETTAQFLADLETDVEPRLTDVLQQAVRELKRRTRGAV